MTDTTTTATPNAGDTQIANELASHAPQYDLAGARKAGVSDAAIVAELAPHFPQYDLAGARAAFAAHATTTPATPAAAPAPFDRAAYIASRQANAQLASLGPMGAVAAFMTARPEPVAPGAQPSLLQSVKDHLASGSSYGFGAKAGAALDAIDQNVGAAPWGSKLDALEQTFSPSRSLTNIVEGTQPLSPYDKELASRRAALDQEAQANPKTAIASDVAGTIVSPLSWLPGVAGMAPVEGSGLLANLARAARGGAVMGTASALGNNDSADVGDKLAAVARGAGTGALGGAVGGVVGAIAPKVLAAIPGVNRLPGISRLVKAPIPEAEQTLAQQLATPEAVANRAALQAAGNGDQMLPADLLPNLAKKAATAPEGYATLSVAAHARDASNIATEAANAAADAQSNDAALASLGNNSTAKGLLRSAQQDTKAYAATAYGPLDANPTVPMSGDLAHVRSQPDMESLFQKVKAEDHADGATPVSRIIRTPSGGSQASSLGLTQMQPLGSDMAQPFSTVKAFQSAIQGKANAAFRAGDNAEGIRLANNATSIGAHLNDNLSGFNYADISAGYAEKKGVERAIVQGVKDWGSKADPRDIQSAFASLSPNAQAAYQNVQGANLIKTLGNTSNANAGAYFRGLVGGKKALAEIAFGGPEQFQSVIDHLSTPTATLPSIALPDHPGAPVSVRQAFTPVAKDGVPSWYSIAALATGRPGAAVGMMARAPIARGVAAIGARGEQASQSALAKLLVSNQGEQGINAFTQSVAAKQAANTAAQQARNAVGGWVAPRIAATANNPLLSSAISSLWTPLGNNGNPSSQR